MMRYNNVEFRQSGIPDSHGHKTHEDRPSEIIAWVYNGKTDEETCYTICWLKSDKEGYIIIIKVSGSAFVMCPDKFFFIILVF